MSGVLEKTLGGLVHSVFGASTTNSVLGQSIAGVPGLKNVSLGCAHFVEKLQAAQRISKQEEEHCVEHESREWMKLLANPQCSGEVVCDVLCRALLVKVRGYSLPSLNIHAIKLTQSSSLLHKKIGYLFVSQSLEPGSELTLLLVNTIHRDLAAPNALQVAASLASLPTVISPDILPAIITALTHCLAHKQVYIRKRSAEMVGLVAVRCTQELQETAGDQVPHLLHLLTHQDPGVALAAITALCKVYRACDQHKPELQDQIAKSASHMLTQALNDALPRDYKVNTLPAPFVQIQMLRVLQQLSCKDWQVPAEVLESVEMVLSQPWGGKEVAVYAVLLECVFTVTALPYHEALTSTVLKVVLGFLKSTNTDLKYVGLKALASVFSVVEEALTPSHLEAVLDCLYHSNPNLQAKTLKLLCAMANVHNYQAVCTTLLEFSGRIKDAATQKVIVGELASITSRYCRDVVWCVQLLSPLIMATSSPDTRVVQALIYILQQGFQEEEQVQASTEASQELLLKVFSHSCPGAYVPLAASVLNLHYASHPKHVSKYFTDSFLENVSALKLKEDDEAIFQCLKNIGLNDDSACGNILAILQPLTVKGKVDLVLWQKATQIQTWLKHPTVSRRVIRRQEMILSQQESADLTLSFLDNYVLRSLESGAVPLKPLSVVVAGARLGGTSEEGEERWGRAHSLGSEDGHSSTTPSTSTTSHNTSTLTRSLITSTKRVWSAEGRVRHKVEGDELQRCGVSVGPEPEGPHTSLFQMDAEEEPEEEEEEEDEVTEGSVELADEAQEEEEPAVTAPTEQRSQLTQALLAGLGMAKLK